MLRQLVRQLKPGGIVAFHEFDLQSAASVPESPLFAQAMKWANAALVGAGVDDPMGLKRYSSFVAAGLPAPCMSMDTCIGGGPNFPGLVLLPEVTRSLLPAIERLGIATAEEVQIESLDSRMRAEIAEINAFTILPPLIGAWTKSSCCASTPGVNP